MAVKEGVDLLLHRAATRLSFLRRLSGSRAAAAGLPGQTRDAPRGLNLYPSGWFSKFGGFLLALPLLGSAALAAHSDWTGLDQAQLRLHLTRTETGAISGGIEIALEPGWHTYWRNPGDAGIPPVFDFSGSENVADVEVSYPAPSRYEDGGTVSVVYTDEVVLPLTIHAVDPQEPVTLRVNAKLGLCREVCIPAEADLGVTMQADDDDPLARTVLRRAREQLPQASEPGRFAFNGATRTGGGIEIAVRVPGGASEAQVFASDPTGAYVAQPEFVSVSDNVARFRISLGERSAPERLLIVAIAGGAAIEQEIIVPGASVPSN